jgi:hypothetical protein
VKLSGLDILFVGMILAIVSISLKNRAIQVFSSSMPFNEFIHFNYITEFVGIKLFMIFP